MNRIFIGDKAEYNACVGKNGFLDFTVEMEFSKYSKGYDELVKISLENLEKHPYDLIVYPLVYSARHSIELFLKAQLLKIHYIRNKIISKKDSQFVCRTHELSTLFLKLQEECKFENRLISYNNQIESYIKDFSEIDDNGEVFRYPISVGGKKHLNDLEVINLLSFKTCYFEISDLMESFDLYTDFLMEEYSQNTFVGEVLSRDDLFKIAKELPPHIEWRDESFLDIKEEIKKKFNITSNKILSKAIDKIKDNYEMRSYIGIENTLPISSGEIQHYFAIYQAFSEIIKEEGLSDSILIDYCSQLKDNISEDTIYVLCQLYDMGYFNLYPEEFDYGLKYKKETKSKYFDEMITSYLLMKRNVKEKILKGLCILKQEAILKTLD